jgi:alkylhydroperoxidase/carboxymuconolactone decarboxylase family protein YurZ
MNDYPDIIEAMDKFLARKGLTEETKQVMAFVIALAHRVQRDVEGSTAPRKGRSRPPVAYADRAK